ncbi:hypothetical protein [Bacteroides stercorirosoris]|uniref:Uncharacterized protein n=1 Tax=Bacteroides stercorirosoris TaxID=871324 RepID=A0A1M6DGJ3_9BACE|nr:hypothetical protein [Bacteroides stercorirosoris]SHI72233.1 hypothetical protein SAMN05444350_106145 [Bacteroides stercorirosoris]
MKKLIYYITLTSLFLWGCQNDNLENIKGTEQVVDTYDSNITYPMAATTRSIDNLSTFWETIEQIKLPSGNIVYTPWNPNYSKSTIPTDYSRDIQKADGWNIIAHTINGVESGLNYILFYNKFTGMLKVFYYLEHNYSQTTGLWHVRIDRPQNLLAFTNSFANAIDYSNKIQDVYCSNITINQNKAFTEGWNCFELELAYDPYFTTGIMQIEPCGIIQSDLSISGNYELNSEGNIITMNNQKTGNLKGSGEDAKKYITSEASKVTNSPIHGINVSGISASSLVVDMLKKGVAKLFKSFTSRTKEQKPQEYKLQFTTNGTATLNGNITTNLGGGFSPIEINISNDKVGILGVWNLLKQPEIQFNTLGRHIATSETTFPTFRIYGAGKELYYPIRNPDIKANESYTYNIFTGTHDDNQAPYGSLNGGMNYSGKGTHIYDGLYTAKAVEFKVYFPGVDNHDRSQIPGMIYLYDSTGEYSKFGIANDYIFRVILTLNIGDIQVTSTKSFIPKLEWRKDNLEFNKGCIDQPDAKFILQQMW